jgi:adenylylsulfate kinase
MEPGNATFLFTGLSGSGKTTLSRAVAEHLNAQGLACLLIDGDQLRHGLCSDLGYSKEDRFENVRRAGEMARLFSQQGFICLCALISPYQAMREALRERLAPAYHEIFVDCPLEECIHRDPKSFYKQAQQGKIANYTGIAAPYEPPLAPDLRITTGLEDIEHSVKSALQFILKSLHG